MEMNFRSGGERLSEKKNNNNNKPNNNNNNKFNREGEPRTKEWK
jgi:hypothetical protein